jgi:hypothetical protein
LVPPRGTNFQIRRFVCEVQKPKGLLIMDNYEKKPDFQVKQSSQSSGTTIAIIVAALVLVVGTFLYFGNNWNTTTDGPQVTQNNTTLPAPIIEEPAATPPAQPAIPLVTPPADAPAANP